EAQVEGRADVAARGPGIQSGRQVGSGRNGGGVLAAHDGRLTMDPLTPSMEMSAMQVRRDEIEQRLAAGEHARAKRLLAGFWRSSPQASTARYVLARHEQLKERFPVERRRIAILRSFTLEPLEAMLRAEALVEAQLELQVRFGEFNAYMQEALDPNSWLGEACPEAIILAV